MSARFLPRKTLDVVNFMRAAARAPVHGEKFTDLDRQRVNMGELCRPGGRDPRTLVLPKFPPGDPRSRAPIRAEKQRVMRERKEAA